MKRSIMISAMALLPLVSCTWKGEMDRPSGYLTFSDSEIALDMDVTTRAAIAAGGSFCIRIVNDNAEEVVHTTYGDIRKNGNKVALKEGSYTLVASSSHDGVPAAAFEQPIYGASKTFSIEAGKETSAGSLTCTLMQTKVTVAYNDDFISTVTGDGVATVSVAPEHPLAFALSYNAGSPVYDQSSGYFAVDSGTPTTMSVTFKGSVEGKMQKMTKVFTNVMPRSWHQIKFVKKVNEEGNASFVITIDDFVDDQPLDNDVAGEEGILGDDPNAPAGDGGITLESTCGIDIYQPIEVPALGSAFTLTMKASVPNKVKRFAVEIQSTNPDFVASVGAVNDGQSTLDLVNPSAGAVQVFTNILPFPYGSDVYGKSEIDFDLSEAQAPILSFPGTHTFVMHVTDQTGCRKDIEIKMTVN